MQRRDIMQNFVKPHQPGVSLKSEYERLIRRINLPDFALDELGLSNKDGAPQSSERDVNISDLRQPLPDVFKDGKVQVFKSFFQMMINLKNHKREFAVVFRGFGNDVQKVVSEFNRFCEGTHPLYNGRHGTKLARFDGSKGSKNFIIDEKQTSVLFRPSDEVEDASLVQGTLQRIHKKNKSPEQLYKEEIEKGSVVVYEGASNIYLSMIETLKDKCGMVIQDDHINWELNGKQNGFAKPLLIDADNYSTLQIFFDDGVELNNETNIIDTKNVVTRENIPIEESLGKYVVKVDTIGAITDNDYFYKIIDQCEKRRQEEIDRIEKGEEKVEIKSDWEIFQSLDDAELLRKYVFPLVYPALEIVDKERPEDPVSFLAFYLLKNKEKIKLPQAPPPQINQAPEGEGQKEEEKDPQ